MQFPSIKSPPFWYYSNFSLKFFCYAFITKQMQNKTFFEYNFIPKKIISKFS